MSGITRRGFLVGAASMTAVSNVPWSSRADARASETIVLEDENLRAVFDRQYGSLLSLENKQTGWRMQDRSQFGAGFRMHVPLPEQRSNFVTEKENPLKSATMGAGNRGVSFLWSKLASPHAGMLDITLRASVELNGPGLVITTDLENRSSLPVESLAYPILGDIAVPSQSKTLFQATWGYAAMEKTELFPSFVNNGVGYWGPFYPTQFTLLRPVAQFVLIFADAEGVYVGHHDAQAQTTVAYEFQLEPGYADSLMSAVEDATLRKDSTRITLQVIQFLFAAPGHHKTSSPILLRPYKGSWHAGVDVYKEWRKTWFTPPAAPAWVNDVHSWQQVQIASSEDRLLFPYTKLVDYGKDCAKHGVKAIQLTGWNKGGQDRGNPSHDTDPRLGTTEELREAIAACRKMGVEVILFNKFTWADSSTEWYKKELFRYAVRNPYGDTYQWGGWNYDTPTQLAGINTRHLIPMCMACPEWREIALREFQKSLELGADGILQDEASWHGPSVYFCFSADHGHPVPAFVFSGDLPLAEGMRKQIDPERFLIAGESLWDVQHCYYRLGYSRIYGAEHIPLQRYIDPHLPLMIAATGWNDRQMINRALLYRYVISYEPYGFKGRLDDFPLTIEYGKKVDALRRAYKAYLWDGEFRDTLGASVTVAGKAHSQYAVFVKQGTGQRALAIANPEDRQEIVCEVDLPQAQRLSVVTPEALEPRDFSGRLRLPVASAAVLLEL